MKNYVGKSVAKKTEELEKAKRVLEYWYAIEFLAQDKYDDMWEVCTKMQKAQNDFLNGSFKGNTIWSYRELRSTHSIYETVLADAKSCGMTRWGNITVYIGKIKREACIECIAKIVPEGGGEERPEKTYDNIAWASLQISPDGTYVDHSLSLSTIIWSMNQMKKSQGSLAESIDEKQYRTAVENIENKFFGRVRGSSQSVEDKTPQLEANDGDQEHIQEFAHDVVNEKVLKDLFKHIEKEFVTGNINSEEGGQVYQEVYGLHFQLFKDEKCKNKAAEDNYLGLSHDYFSEDIKYVLQKINDNSISSGGYMSQDVVRYISALGDNNQSDKIDLVNPEDQKKFYQQISEVMEVGNAPLGKWPTRFMPAFMQQVAVNLCIRKSTSELYGINGNVFSVNGPPGTGKTTLLKEIVVSNIVERAILLSKYKDPDDAFEKHSFLHGDKKENAYSSFTRGWYRLKNDRINNYSTLVTSCNNAAVENVSKELPLSTGLLKDLKPASDDTEDYAAMLDELSGLFNPEQSQIYETISKKTCRDVYFTEYAKELFGNADVWGLVAAPLGKKSNISAFYNRVLYPLHWDFYPGKDFKDTRIEKYEHARVEFEKQLKVVRVLKTQLKEICAFVYKRTNLIIKCNDIERKLPEKKIKSVQLIEAETLHIDELNGILPQKVNDMQIAAAKRDKFAKLVYEMERQVNEQSVRKKELLEKEVATRGAASILDKIFKKKKVAANELLAEVYHEDALKAGIESERLTALLCELNASFLTVQQNFERAETSKRQIEIDIADRKSKVNEMENQIHEIEINLDRMKTELSDTETSYIEKTKIFTQEKSLDAGLIFDEAFMANLLSQNIEESTSAQVSNPWFTKHYNIEREKLFYYAMMLNKEFVLSSKSCRDNFKTLGHYWGMCQGDDKETVLFHKEDRERFVGAIYQTLFLLVPVLSSTFASLGTFLRDAKQTGVIGTLVVDEAGQAQPQMVVGALYRSRKAMIVGDPKQVEPVVTDDLNLLKRVFDDEILKPYKSKTISVQSFADRLNCFGTWLDNGTDYPEWVGCPLLVHRRCISPMYDISNEISYNGIMKQQTREPDAETTASFASEKSQWINVTGKERGNKNHFVEEQAQKVCEILESVFSKSDNPSLYIISPFTSVVSEMRAYIKKYKRKTADTNLCKCESEWLSKNIGTVHTFQGKEANEVIFLLGCDKSREAVGAIKWVNTNIVNVAVTRAKFRLYVIGDETAWKKSSCVMKAKTILDTFAIKKIKAILEEQLPKEEEARALTLASESLPSITSFKLDAAEDENGIIDFSVDTQSFLQGLSPSFMTSVLSKEQLGKFGFESIEELDEFPQEIQDNLQMGIKLYYLLQPVFNVNKKLDASCCAILFCKALELQMRNCFEDSLKAIFPNEKINGQGRGKVELKNAKTQELTLGAFGVLIKRKSLELGSRMEIIGNKEYNVQWWNVFKTRLSKCTSRRNNCCHSGLFSWTEQSYLLADMFKKSDQNTEVQMDGILFESRIGKKLQ